MNNYPNYVKDKLLTTLNDLKEYHWLLVDNPETDFTRNRKLPFDEMIRLILSMGGNSLNLELMEYFSFSTDTATSSAFIQQRSKILPEAFELLFHLFTEKVYKPNLYHGYRLLAVDGSDLSIPHNPEDKTTYIPNGPNVKGYNQLHLNAMYDLRSRVYVDALVQPARKECERQSLIDMVERYSTADKPIIIADRGYESYNVFEHISKKEMNYMIRVKDVTSNGIASGLTLPAQDIFDVDYELIMTRSQAKYTPELRGIFKFMPSNQRFDYLPTGNKKDYPFKFRILRFPISETTFEVIITNLDRDIFTPEVIKDIYHQRWGIETSFRELKYAIGLTHFHSKKVAYILQEIFARLIMYNFCEVITTHVVLHQKDCKHLYQVNFTFAIAVCLRYFRIKGNKPPSDVEALIQKNILPIRPGRKDPRKVSTSQQ